MALQVKGKTALVTGGGSGICFEFTKLLLNNGCNVLVADLDLRPEVADAYAQYTGSPKVVFQKTDVTDWKQLRAAFDAARREFDALDIVCPGAGIFDPPWANFWELDAGVDNDNTSSFRTVDVNINHPLRATQLAIDYFMRHNGSRGGAIVHISSIGAQLNVMPVAIYCASKHAISSFVRSLALLEPQCNIRVVAVAPGIVKTPIWSDKQRSWVDETVDKWVSTKEVTEAMLDLIQNPDMVGGTVLEIAVGKTRKVEEVNDPGPGSEGHSITKIADSIADTFGLIGQYYGKLAPEVKA